MSLYDFLFLGCREYAARDARDTFVNVVANLIADSGVEKNDVKLLTDPSGYLEKRDLRKPTVVACFSDPSAAEVVVLEKLMAARVPVIPIAQSTERFEDFPALLRPLNGTVLPDNRCRWIQAGIAVLDCVGLLRAQRRLFISYRRKEARYTAVQLHDELSSRGFQVFLDTHSIRPGRVFQDNLWHNLCDSDVMVMLDTPGYFCSRWTREEFGRAQSMGITMLRLVWPGHNPERESELSEQYTLDKTDFKFGVLEKHVLEDIVDQVERLRARGMAARHTEVAGKLKVGIEATGGRIVGIGAYRSVSIKLKNGVEAWAYPVIGVPTANLMHDISQRAQNGNQSKPYLVYDHTGITEPWLMHLDWLDKFIPEVDFLRVSDTVDVLSRRVAS